VRRKAGSVIFALAAVGAGWALSGLTLSPPWNWIVLGLSVIAGATAIAMVVWPEKRGGIAAMTAKAPKNATAIESSGGGTGAEVDVTGGPAGSDTVGLETEGLKVTQTGPGTGLKVTVKPGGGSVTGIRSTTKIDK
jgi:hypothetical protein